MMDFMKRPYKYPELRQTGISVENVMETSVGGGTEDYTDGGTYTW